VLIDVSPVIYALRYALSYADAGWILIRMPWLKPLRFDDRLALDLDHGVGVPEV
jgi:hypothetical protein